MRPAVGFARFWATSLGLCAADVAFMARDAVRWTQHRIKSSRSSNPQRKADHGERIPQ